jgi:hypothetical protein
MLNRGKGVGLLQAYYRLTGGLLEAYWCSKGEVADKKASSTITYASMGSISGVRH